MIRVETITVKEFRGIYDLTLDFKGKNFAICGPNGTGKSGIVDALEFALTGNVSRLSGEGRGDISLKEHGPHVDSRSAPSKARVTVKLAIPSLGKSITVERSVAAPSAPTVTPSDPAILAVLRRVAAHPETVLSRRELIRYVLATPGKRADEVQALLHLDQVAQVRSGLQKIANASEKHSTVRGNQAADDRAHLLRALGTTELKIETVLAAANEQRAILGLPALAELTDATSLKDGMATPGIALPQRIPKAQAVTDIKTARDVLAEISGVATAALAAEAKVELEALAADPLSATGVTRENFYTIGLALVEAGPCPLCDTSWDLVNLRNHVRTKLDRLKDVSLKRKAAEGRVAPLIALLRRAQSAIDSLVRYATQATPPIAMNAASAYSESCRACVAALGAFLPLANTIAILESFSTVAQAVHDSITAFDKVVATISEPSKQDSARDWLTLAQERLEVYRAAMRKKKAAKAQSDTARKVYDLYAATSDTVLSRIYADVEKDFAAMYRFVNRDDETRFTAKLVPTLGKLSFDVDFYGRGFFPPGAYHSEGHQDGMGLCLYLSLMRHLHGTEFTFAVLDDVLMSVDAGHRREVCALLKKEFPNTQFIMTTHDPIWLRHMKTEGLIGGRSSVQFRNWSVDQGPSREDERDVWTEIEDYLEKSDVRGAASLLRHHLEYVSAELCHRLRVPVEYRGDAQYQLGELLPVAIAHMRKLHGCAKVAANSWNQRAEVEQIGALEAQFAVLASTSQAEQWQVNVAVHFNSWENLGKNDFAPVAKAYRELLAGFTCPACSEFLRVVPDREARESLRCDCGKTNLNFKLKPKNV